MEKINLLQKNDHKLFEKKFCWHIENTNWNKKQTPLGYQQTKSLFDRAIHQFKTIRMVEKKILLQKNPREIETAKLFQEKMGSTATTVIADDV